MTRILCFAFLTLGIVLLAAPAVQAGEYIIDQTISGGYNAHIKGQTFTPNIGINPDPGNLATLKLTAITFYRSGQGWDGPTSDFYLNIYDGDPVNGTGTFVGSSTNSVDVATLSNMDPIPWTFDYLTLDYTHEYWALVSSTNTDGGLDVKCGMREGGSSPYAGGTAIGGNASDPWAFNIKATTDLTFEIVLRDKGYYIDQTVSGGSNAHQKGQTFTPSIGIDPDPGTPSTLDLKAITFMRSSQDWGGPTSDFYLNIYDGDPVNGTGAFVGSSSNTVDVSALSDKDPISWTFDHLTLDYNHEYWALVSSTDTDGGLDVKCGMREGGSSPYTGGTAIAGNASDPWAFNVKASDLAFRIDLMDTFSLMADAETLSESTGGEVYFALRGDINHANRDYLLLGGVTGTEPGFPLPGGWTLPLNWDAFTSLVFSLVYADAPSFFDFQGSLDASGKATAHFNTFGPLPSGSAGVKVYFAYLLYYPFDFVSNPVTVEIVP